MAASANASAAMDKKINRRLSPEELCQLAERLIYAADPAEVARLEEEFERGFYGEEPPDA